MHIRRVVILHGYNGYPEKHWFGWLRDELAPHGIDTHIPLLPDADNPHAGVWTDAALAAIGTPTSETLVIGHSLGTVTAIRALGHVFAADGDARLGALALVAPFASAVPGLAMLDPFAREVPDLAGLAARIERRLVVHSDFDPIVPIALAEPIIAGLDAEVVEVSGGGHFMESEGWKTLPPLRDWILEG